MGILDTLQKKGSNLSEFDGKTPKTPNFPDSKLHYEYSLNGNPSLKMKPEPSTLDLDGKTPSKYTENLPG